MRLFISLIALLICSTKAEAVTQYFRNYSFEAYLISDSYPQSRLYEIWDGSRRVLRVEEGQEYSIVVHNPLPVRVGAAVTVDGLNTIDGKRTRPADGGKWLIEPYSTITIRGWQTGSSRLRKFVFTNPWQSYANWKEERDRRQYTDNLGVIGVAFFWNNQELHRALYPPRPYHYDKGLGYPGMSEAPPMEDALRHRADQTAGTGMGRAEYHNIQQVHFSYDSGMYSSADVLKIYYEFGAGEYLPEPFDGDHGGRPELRYAPEMPFWGSD